METLVYKAAKNFLITEHLQFDAYLRKYIGFAANDKVMYIYVHRWVGMGYDSKPSFVILLKTTYIQD